MPTISHVYAVSCSPIIIISYIDVIFSIYWYRWHRYRWAYIYINTKLSRQMPLQRGWFHLSLVPLGLAIILYLSALPFHSLHCVICATLSILCILSHHIRDGVHHGLDFYPLGTTPVLPYWLYIVLTLTLPIGSSYLSSSLIRLLRPSHESLTESMSMVWIINHLYHHI